MSNEVDYYDVQRMILDARSELRSEILSEVRHVLDDLRREVLGEITSLGRDLSGEIQSIARTMDERTAHLV